MYEMLVVDDEAGPRDTLSTCFPWSDLGFHVCGQAQNGKEALDYIEEHVVHVVFTDICMPVLDGLALAREISQRKGRRPMVVLLSAYGEFKFAQEAIKYGVKYYILKPPSFEELRELFRKLKSDLDRIYGKEDEQEHGHEDKIIAAVYKYCGGHYRDGSLTELSAQLFLSSSYLSQLIRQKTDKTFTDILNETRMKQAAVLLQDPDAKIYYISQMVGYQNPNNFTRAFKNFYGVSPSEYKEGLKTDE
ncbi:response regulator transcription factor [Lachnotalea sp. AF33-28]|jgi:two-component system response regulator YesN|uniref:response regulator transcription factor n=1 Tax=Lachnotalea sp. AF33-28 TaxID=2292046 RepID=UPI000E4DA901|nr:response regulator [Lachnotalea sp. AF33-28]RHP31516.1 response regulator [Lachnotalea sp. AF33-28]